MKYGKILLVAAVAGCVAQALAAEESERDVFRKWRIAIGGAFNGRVSADLNARNLPVPPPTGLEAAGNSFADAWGNAVNRRYDGGGYINDGSADDGDWSTDWRLPEGSYLGQGKFVLDNAYQRLIPGDPVHTADNNTEDPCQFGISLEASRELWLHDEKDEHRWGVDFAAALSYFFQRDVYQERGDVTRTDTLRNGVVRTVVEDPDATYDYDNINPETGMYGDYPTGGFYGHGNRFGEGNSPSLNTTLVGRPTDVPGASTVASSSAFYEASGDYQELEMLFLLRPWYEITDWWRVYGNVGLGVSWGRLDTEFRGLGVSAEEDFSQWDAYGVAGLGTMFRYDRFDLSVDFLGRFLRDDMDVHGRFVEGTISRADWGIRVMVGCEF